MKHSLKAGLGVVVAGILFTTFAPRAQAVPTIDVENGGVTLNSTNTGTTGKLFDPWLINENMTSAGTLRFSGGLGGANSTGTGQTEGRWFSKTIVNNTGVVWTSFELELQVTLGIASGEGDGISFAQNSGLVFSSDVFSTYTQIDDTRDYLNFSGGVVGIGESVTLNFVITDNAANNPFYLLQTPNIRDVPDSVPEPTTLGVLGLGLAGLGLLRRRRAA